LTRTTLVALLAALGGARALTAQARPQAPAPTVQPEVRADFIDARASQGQIGVGFAVPAGTYVRLGAVAAVGQAWHDGVSKGAARIDGLVRFTVDPFRESRWAPYAAGGIGAIYDGFEKWRGVLVGVIGVEGPASGSLVPAFEVGFGGGARFGVALRRAIRGRR
jgi:hypothetical protein